MANKKHSHYDCFEKCILEFEHGILTMEVAMKGISMVRGMPQSLEVLNEIYALKTGKKKNIQEQDIQKTRELSNFAEDQIKEGFPLLVQQTLISLWSFLEASIYDAAVQWLVISKFKTINIEKKNIEVPFFEFQNASLADRAGYLIDSYLNKKSSKTDSSHKFENLFEFIGWHKGGRKYKEYAKREKVNERKIEKDIIEFSKIRNLILHKAGIVDKKFKTDCPWREDKLGSKIVITREEFGRYVASSMIYVVGIANRASDCENELKKN